MSTSFRSYKRSIITNGVMTGTDVLTSEIIDCAFLSIIGIDARWTGTPNGTLEVEYSADGSNWFAGVAITDPAGSASSAQASVTGFPWAYARVKYTNSSSTGVLNVYAVGKNQ